MTQITSTGTTPETETNQSENLENSVIEVSQAFESLSAEVGKVVVGQREMVSSILMGLLTDGHVLLEGAPGLAKTLTISTLAQTLDLNFQRIQFTPDLLPSDLIGTMIFNAQTHEFVPKKGPIFSQIILADEINRAPAKVQSALLEAMAERQVTIGEKSYSLPDPFLVLATQNPLEQEGTYPLPEAQMDRFQFKVLIQYPQAEEEMEILNRMATRKRIQPQKVVDFETLSRARNIVDRIHIDENLKKYIVDLVVATREPQKMGLKDLLALIQVGASPRATISIVRAAKGHAFLRKRAYVTLDDIKSVAYSVLRHRLILSFEAEAEEVSPDEVIKRILVHLDVPR